MSPARRRAVRIGLLGVVTILGCGVLYVVANNHPSTYVFFPKCLLHAITGLHCPGCGLTRSVHSLLNGELVQALAYNVLWPIVLPLIALSVGRSLWHWAWGAPPRTICRPRRPSAKWLPYLAAGLILLYAVVRNIPYYPFTLLAPHELNPPQ